MNLFQKFFFKSLVSFNQGRRIINRTRNGRVKFIRVCAVVPQRLSSVTLDGNRGNGLKLEQVSQRPFFS